METISHNLRKQMGRPSLQTFKKKPTLQLDSQAPLELYFPQSQFKSCPLQMFAPPIFFGLLPAIRMQRKQEQSDLSELASCEAFSKKIEQERIRDSCATQLRRGLLTSRGKAEAV